jgi:purine-binding chemotaxis protein CheW
VTGFDWTGARERLEQARRDLEEGAVLTADAAQRLLESRAADLAQPRQEAAAPVDTLDLLVFSRGEEAYALDAAHVVEVFPLDGLTPVPFVPPSVLGVVNHRGRILPVIDLGDLLGATSPEGEPALVLAVEAGAAAFGIGADTVSGVTTVAADEVVPAARLAEQPDRVVRGVTEAMAAVLDLEALARDPRIEVNDEYQS